MNKLFSLFIPLIAFAAFPLNGATQEKIQMTLENSGVYTVPCEVNGLRMRLIFDTGAKDVQLSSVEALFMLRNGYIDEDDFVGTGMYSTADGTISEHAIVILKTIKIGSKVLTDVKACISSNIDAPMLLGQSALSKLGAYSIDGSTLILNGLPGNSIYDLKGNPVSAYYTGKGTCRYKENGVYTGDFVNGKMDGRGVIDFGKEGIFEGTFKNGNAIYGTHTYNDGDKYVGPYKNGSWNGKGTYYYSDGSIYKGDFVDDVCEGIGTLTQPNGDKYVGDFKYDVPWGKGTFYYADGSKFTGEFYNGLKEGKGILTYPNGKIIRGTWKNDELQGNDRQLQSNNDYEFERNNFGTKDNEDYYLAQAKTEVNLRSGPGTEFKILTKIPSGGYVVVTSGDSHQAFRKVLYTDKNIIGYVSRNYLTNFQKIDVDERGNLQVEGRNYKQNADVKIKNNTNKNITIVIGNQTYVFSPFETRTLYDIAPKRYKVMASAPGVIPYVGFDTIQGGYEYSWTFYIRTGRQ